MKTPVCSSILIIGVEYPASFQTNEAGKPSMETFTFVPDGLAVVVFVGLAVVVFVGLAVGFSVGLAVLLSVGIAVSASVGIAVSASVGAAVGDGISPVGASVTVSVAFAVGASVAFAEGELIIIFEPPLSFSSPHPTQEKTIVEQITIAKTFLSFFINNILQDFQNQHYN